MKYSRESIYPSHRKYQHMQLKMLLESIENDINDLLSLEEISESGDAKELREKISELSLRLD